MMNLDVRMRVGLRIKELRTIHGISQEQFAYQIDMARTYFAEVETGKRNISIVNLERIADGFGISLKYFFDSEYFKESS